MTKNDQCKASGFSVWYWLNKYYIIKSLEDFMVLKRKKRWVIFPPWQPLSFLDKQLEKEKQTLSESESHLSVSKKSDTQPTEQLQNDSCSDHNPMVWLSVAVHTVSGTRFHTICMIRLIGLVWKQSCGFSPATSAWNEIRKWWQETSSSSSNAQNN